MSYNEWLDIDVLEDYLDGKLDAKAMHKVEKLSLEDPFVAEALAGLSQSPKRTQSLSLLQKQLQERIAQKPIEKKRWAITSQRLSVASAAAVIFIAVGILFWMKDSKRQEMMAANTPKKVDVTIAPQVAAEKAKTSEPIQDNVTAETPLASKPVAKSPDPKNEILKKDPIVAVNNKPIQAHEPVVASAARDIKVAEETEVITLARAKKQAEATPAIVALQSKAEGVTAGKFTGKVVSKENGMPIQGAIVRLAEADRGTMTDKNGEFKLFGDSVQNQKITVGYGDFSPAEVGAKSNQPVNVLLETNKNALTAIIASKNEVSPLGGWDNYQKYLKSNNKFVKSIIAKANIIELDFTIKKDGSVSAVKVVQSAGKTNDKEAIRLLKDGPKWIFVPNAQNLGKLKIQF